MARFLGLLGLLSSASLVSAKDKAVVFVVDPSWDCVESYAAHVPLLQEFKIIKVMTNPGKSAVCNSDRADIYMQIAYSSMTPNDALAVEEICPQLRNVGIPIEAVIATFDPAVGIADGLSACVGTRGNPFEGPLAQARRDKWVMGEAVRKAGLRSIKEKKVSTWPVAKEYLESLNPPLSDTHPVIFKILEGSSSEGVTKVKSMQQAEDYFSSKVGTKSTFGATIDVILIQEFLAGKEYVIDSASRDGVHKVSMVWNEDLRPGNGIFDLYYGFKVMNPEDPKIATIIDYSNKVLDATGLANGAADMEVMWLDDEDAPCLVEINARWTALMWHDGLRLERAVTGNDQITATINAYLDGEAFNKMPAVPAVSQYGAIIFTNVWHTGILDGLPGMAVTEKLPSYFGSYNKYAVVGKVLKKFTAGDPPITVLLANDDEAVVDADYDRIIGLENADAFWRMRNADASTTALRLGGSLPGQRMPALPAVVALAALGVAAALALFARSRRGTQDGTEYIIIN